MTAFLYQRSLIMRCAGCGPIGHNDTPWLPVPATASMRGPLLAAHDERSLTPEPNGCCGLPVVQKPGGLPMKRTLIAAAALATLALNAPAVAQGVGVQVGPVGAGITFAPEQRTRVREYVTRERVAPVTVKERIAVGTRLPADVELRSVPADWGPSVSRYRYVYSNDRVYF